MHDQWRLVDRSPLNESKVLQAEIATFERVDVGHRFGATRVVSPDWVNVIVLTDENPEQIILVRQYRFGTERATLEIPGGVIEPHETPLEGAQRETREETGYDASSWECIGVVEPNPAFLPNRCYTFLARGAKLVAEQDCDPEESIEVVLRPATDFTRLIAIGEITHSLVIAAAFWWVQKSGRNT
jgi:8-oxo-dGTP pyrophosphatase MutT (NUDIX family)